MDLDQDGGTSEALSRIRHHSSVPVIVCSGRATERDRVSLFNLGADDFLSKPYSFAELEARVRAVLRRGTGTPTTTLEHGDLVIDQGTRTVTVGLSEVPMTRKEFDLLAFLAAAPGRVFSRDDLLERVWGSNGRWQGRSTVTEHIRRVRLKIEADPRTRAGSRPSAASATASRPRGLPTAASPRHGPGSRGVLAERDTHPRPVRARWRKSVPAQPVLRRTQERYVAKSKGAAVGRDLPEEGVAALLREVPEPGHVGRQIQRTASQIAQPAKPVNTTAVTMRTVAMFTTRRRLCPLTTARPATVQRASSAPIADREGVVVVRGQVGRKDLREVAPLGQEDDEERGDGNAAVRGHLTLDQLPPPRALWWPHAGPGVAPPKNIAATKASRARCGNRWNSATPMVTAITTWTAKAAAAPSHTMKGRPRVDITSDANIVLSGSSPEEDDRKDGNDDVELHSDLSVPVCVAAERSVRGPPTIASEIGRSHSVMTAPCAVAPRRPEDRGEPGKATVVG